MLTAQAVFLLERGQTDRQTDRQTEATECPSHSGGYTAGGSVKQDISCVSKRALAAEPRGHRGHLTPNVIGGGGLRLYL